MKKKIGIGIAVLVLGAIAVFMLSNPLGGLIKLAIESLGPDMLQAKISVSNVKISTADGQGVLKKFNLGNPKGFKTDHAFKADRIEIVIEPTSIAQDIIVISKVLIVAPNIIYESSSSGTNFDILQRNVDTYLGASTSNKGKKDTGKKVIIKSFEIRDAEVNYNGTIDLPLPNIELRDIGKKSGGASFAQVSKRVFSELNSKLSFSKSSVIDSVGAAAKGAGSAAKGAGNAIKGLFGK